MGASLLQHQVQGKLPVEEDIRLVKRSGVGGQAALRTRQPPTAPLLLLTPSVHHLTSQRANGTRRRANLTVGEQHDCHNPINMMTRRLSLPP